MIPGEITGIGPGGSIAGDEIRHQLWTRCALGGGRVLDSAAVGTAMRGSPVAGVAALSVFVAVDWVIVDWVIVDCVIVDQVMVDSRG